MRVHTTESGDIVRLGRRRLPLAALALPAAALVALWAGSTNRLPEWPGLSALEASWERLPLPIASLRDVPLPQFSLPDWSVPQLAPPKLSLFEPKEQDAALRVRDAKANTPNMLPAAAAVASGPLFDGLLDPGYALGPAPLALGRSEPLPSSLQLASAPPAAVDPSPAVGAQAALDVADVDDPEADIPDLAPPAPLHSVVEVPLPAARPFELRAPAVAEPRVVAPVQNRRTRAAAIPAAPADDRNFLEKLFNVKKQAETAMAYATPQDDVIDAARGRRLSPAPQPAVASAQFTAIYDISARSVTMPNGQRLEAHSGLGDKLDDPRYVHVRMRGATPPHVYDLSLREQLFHGVLALRLNPVGGKEAIHGRDGLLAHTFMLGPNGDSNGCVSFRDYERFLQAYLRGEVKRLVVVASM